MPEGQETAGLLDSETPTTDTDATPAVKRPRPYDPDWREKVERTAGPLGMNGRL